MLPAPYPCPLPLAPHLEELSFVPSPPSPPLLLPLLPLRLFPSPRTPRSYSYPPPHLAPQVSTFLDGGAAAVASPHVYAISKRAQQVSEITLYSPLYLTAPYAPYSPATYTPCAPLHPLAPFTSHGILSHTPTSAHRHSRRRWPFQMKPRRRRLPRVPSSTNRCSSKWL